MAKTHDSILTTILTISEEELLSNPSHLESVDPVVEGMARAMQDKSDAGAEGVGIQMKYLGDDLSRAMKMAGCASL